MLESNVATVYLFINYQIPGCSASVGSEVPAEKLFIVNNC